jgi:cytochrome c oxidase cbb3-type subunit 4
MSFGMRYDDLRHFADSWGLVMMVVLFMSFVGWTFRKGSRQHMDTAAKSIFQPETAWPKLSGDDDNAQ